MQCKKYCCLVMLEIVGHTLYCSYYLWHYKLCFLLLRRCHQRLKFSVRFLVPCKNALIALVYVLTLNVINCLNYG